MIYFAAVIFIIICIAATSYSKGVKHHDGYHGSYYHSSQKKQWQTRAMDK